ncbi:MAG: isochorismatase family protein [Bacteroidales bacterium]
MKNSAHIVVDMLYDFIDGSMACLNSFEAVKESVAYINAHPTEQIFYIADNHPANHCSFKEFGGIWPPHCVEGTHGQEIHNSYYKELENPGNRPQASNILTKGENPLEEQYSGFEAKSSEGKSLEEYLRERGVEEILLTGIATEYCIRATALDLHNANFKVSILEKGLAYVDQKGHSETIKELKTKGITII